MLKKLLIDKFFRNKYSKFLRNFIGIKPSYYNLDYTNKNITVSDAFFWRTDSNFTTVFSFTDLLNLYYSISNQTIELVFYSKDFKILKRLLVEQTNISNKIIIDKSFFDGLEDFGTFYIFHNSSVKFNSMIRNSCYTGFSYKGCLPSFVHGNTQTSYKNLSTNKEIYGVCAKSFFQKKKYKVQNFFSYDKTELLLMNPCSSRIKIKINSDSFFLDKGCSKIFDINKYKEVKILSNAYLLRPIIINYKNDKYIDAHHG